MINTPDTDIPATPPTRFEHTHCGTGFTSCDTRQDDKKTPDSARISESLWDPGSSSSCRGTLETLSPGWRSPTSTVSWFNFIEHFIECYIDLLHAEERASSVRVEEASENLFELRRLTGFTWAHLANLLNVDRRTLHNWVKGTKIREQNRKHIAETLGVLRFADRGSAELNATALNVQHVQHRLDASEAIRTGHYEVARQLLAPGLSRPDKWQAATPWSGEFQLMVTHADADGTEMIEPLPDEPEPVSRKRPIRHG